MNLAERRQRAGPAPPPASAGPGASAQRAASPDAYAAAAADRSRTRLAIRLTVFLPDLDRHAWHQLAPPGPDRRPHPCLGQPGYLGRHPGLAACREVRPAGRRAGRCWPGPAPVRSVTGAAAGAAVPAEGLSAVIPSAAGRSTASPSAAGLSAAGLSAAGRSGEPGQAEGRPAGPGQAGRVMACPEPVLAAAAVTAQGMRAAAAELGGSARAGPERAGTGRAEAAPPAASVCQRPAGGPDSSRRALAGRGPGRSQDPPARTGALAPVRPDRQGWH